MNKTAKTLFSGESTKAWLAAAGALISALVMGNQDHLLDLNDWLIAGGAFVATLGAVYGVPNKNPEE
jgi:hypothetical protein